MKSLMQTINKRGIQTYTKEEALSMLNMIMEEIEESDCNKWKVWDHKTSQDFPSSLDCEVDDVRGDIIFNI